MFKALVYVNFEEPYIIYYKFVVIIFVFNDICNDILTYYLNAKIVMQNNAKLDAIFKGSGFPLNQAFVQCISNIITEIL